MTPDIVLLLFEDREPVPSPLVLSPSTYLGPGSLLLLPYMEHLSELEGRRVVGVIS